MDEAEVAAKLAENVEPTVPMDGGYPETPKNPDERFVDTMLPEEQLTVGRILDYLEVPTLQRHTPQVDEAVRTVYAWARDNAGTGELPHLLRVIAEREQILGSPTRSGRLGRLAEYVKIHQLRDTLAARERALYG